VKDNLPGAFATIKHNYIISSFLAITQVIAQTSVKKSIQIKAVYAKSSFVSCEVPVKKSIQIKAVYAGIAVGSKGVKLSLIDLGKNEQHKCSFIILNDRSVNTDFISFTPSSFQVLGEEMMVILLQPTGMC
jgi:hypothetical protein